MSSLSEWLAPKTIAWFVENHLQTAPYAAAGAAASAVPVFDWSTIDRVLSSKEGPDVLTVNAGRLVNSRAPGSTADVVELLRSNVSVVVRAAERHDPGLRQLASSFEDALSGEVHVQLYVTPGGTNSYGWHYDFEDVFIAQTRGVKDYYFRANTVMGDTVLGDQPDFTSIRREVSPMFTARLVAGDWLYVPARWWHLVRCVEESLSISVGVMAPSELRRARHLPAGWSGMARARD